MPVRLCRPYIPFIVRCRVAARQIGWGERSMDGQKAAIEMLLCLHRPDHGGEQGTTGYARLLRNILAELGPKLGCEPKDLQLDHDPALENRPFNKRTQKYTPDANDPDFLLYREKHAHKIKTLVRGDGAQLSDAAQARKRKRAERKKHLQAGSARRRQKRPSQVKRAADSGAKVRRKWPSRPLRGKTQWPRGQKMRSRR